MHECSGCLRKVNQTSGTTYPKANSGWAQEISLDLDRVSAICPNWRILLVEASSTSLSDLGSTLTVTVTATNSVGSASRDSAEVAVPAPAPADFSLAASPPARPSPAAARSPRR